jgi:ribosome-binding factor A
MAQPGIRATQVADLIRDTVAPWIQRDNAGFFVSINQVTLVADMSRATVWVSVYPANGAGKVLGNLRKKAGQYGRDLRKQVSRHSVPILFFELDSIEEEAGRIDDLLA